MHELPHPDLAISVPEWDTLLDRLAARDADYWLWADVEQAADELRGNDVPAHELDGLLLYGRQIGRIVSERRGPAGTLWRVAGR